MSGPQHYDLFVIGAGSGGVRAARIAAGHGARVAVCESDRVGGTCVIRGCIPKKLLRYGAHYAEYFEDAAGYGWEVGPTRLDWSRLIAGQNREIDRLNNIYINLLKNAGVDLLDGAGRLTGPNGVAVGEVEYSADKILIATGGRPVVPEIPGVELALVSDDVFDLPRLPKSLLVVGSGYIGCEFAGIFQDFGSEVHLLYRRELLLAGFDHEVREYLTRETDRRGIHLHPGSGLLSIERVADDRLSCRLPDESVLEVEAVLLATGRWPNVDGLNLEAAGVETGPRGAIAVDEYSRTSCPQVFAVGDVTDRLALTPVALNEGHAFADTQFGGQRRSQSHEFVPSAVFSAPPVAVVGYAENEARDRFGDIQVYKSSFRPLVHTLSGRQEQTFMKLIVDAASQRVVGLHVVGMDAPEMVQGFAVAIKAGLRKADFDATVGIHPTAAEELVTMRTPA